MLNEFKISSRQKWGEESKPRPTKIMPNIVNKFSFPFFFQSHKFESTFSITDGYRIRLMELTNGGAYTCHVKHDSMNEHDQHFHVDVNCESSKSSPSGQSHFKKMPITTIAAPNTSNQITLLSTLYSKRKANLIKVSSNLKTNNCTGVGRSSISTTSIMANSFSILSSTPTSMLNLTLNELTTTNVYSARSANEVDADLNSLNQMVRNVRNRRQITTQPSNLDKSKRRG